MTKRKNFGVSLAGGGAISHPDHFYPTPPEPTVALLRHYEGVIPHRVWEPACGQGHMSRVIAAHGYYVLSSDMVHRGYGMGGIDFLTFPSDRLIHRRSIGIITNPPFKHAAEFVRKAHELERPFLALYLKQTFWNAAARLSLWKECQPKAVHPLTWRVDFSGGGAPTMDCMWCVWGNVPVSMQPLERPVL